MKRGCCGLSKLVVSAPTRGHRQVLYRLAVENDMGGFPDQMQRPRGT